MVTKCSDKEKSQHKQHQITPKNPRKEADRPLRLFYRLVFPDEIGNGYHDHEEQRNEPHPNAVVAMGTVGNLHHRHDEQNQ
ncbi:MAG: hypothetical protein IKN21_05905 [Prevotella sp.]|nr:hypothetical protein [Prevotella sp.]